MGRQVIRVELNAITTLSVRAEEQIASAMSSPRSVGRGEYSQYTVTEPEAGRRHPTRGTSPGKELTMGLFGKSFQKQVDDAIAKVEAGPRGEGATGRCRRKGRDASAGPRISPHKETR